MFRGATRHLKPYGSTSRGVTAGDVERAADALLPEVQRPTIERVREKLGTGSPNTINPRLDAWWKKLAARLDAGPAALHRLPESVAHVASPLDASSRRRPSPRGARKLFSRARTRARQTTSRSPLPRPLLTRRRTRIPPPRPRADASRARGTAPRPHGPPPQRASRA